MQIKSTFPMSKKEILALLLSASLIKWHNVDEQKQNTINLCTHIKIFQTHKVPILFYECSTKCQEIRKQKEFLDCWRMHISALKTLTLPDLSHKWLSTHATPLCYVDNFGSNKFALSLPKSLIHHLSPGVP